MEEDFDTLDDFLVKYPLDEITVPVCIESPETKEDYWLIQLALPMKEKVVNCCIWRATTHQMKKYRVRAHGILTKTLGSDF